MGRPSIYKWNDFKKGEVRAFKKKPTRSVVAMMMTLSRDWAKRHGSGRSFSVFSVDRHSVCVKRTK